ncbi:MAG: hypothetical protein ACKVII_17005, partial [Planctomycetales bacterium]
MRLLPRSMKGLGGWHGSELASTERDVAEIVSAIVVPGRAVETGHHGSPAGTVCPTCQYQQRFD